MSKSMSSGQKRRDSSKSSMFRPITKGYFSTIVRSVPSSLLQAKFSNNQSITRFISSLVGIRGLPKCCMYKPVATFEMQMSDSKGLQPTSSLKNFTARSKSASNSSWDMPDRLASFASSMIWVRMSNSRWSTSFPSLRIMALLVLKSFCTRSPMPRMAMPRPRPRAAAAAAEAPATANSAAPKPPPAAPAPLGEAPVAATIAVVAAPRQAPPGCWPPAADRPVQPHW
mmetsp:Transcript_7757/g.28398  ORF Transcript_7757/g.28398 Transcript_7757/m.28398 type:complete len:227 (+) Transcript_7757:187-867(+)